MNAIKIPDYNKGAFPHRKTKVAISSWLCKQMGLFFSAKLFVLQCFGQFIPIWE